MTNRRLRGRLNRSLAFRPAAPGSNHEPGAFLKQLIEFFAGRGAGGVVIAKRLGAVEQVSLNGRQEFLNPSPQPLDRRRGASRVCRAAPA